MWNLRPGGFLIRFLFFAGARRGQEPFGIFFAHLTGFRLIAGSFFLFFILFWSSGTLFLILWALSSTGFRRRRITFRSERDAQIILGVLIRGVRAQTVLVGIGRLRVLALIKERIAA